MYSNKTITILIILLTRRRWRPTWDRSSGSGFYLHVCRQNFFHVIVVEYKEMNESEMSKTSRTTPWGLTPSADVELGPSQGLSLDTAGSATERRSTETNEHTYTVECSSANKERQQQQPRLPTLVIIGYIYIIIRFYLKITSRMGIKKKRICAKYIVMRSWCLENDFVTL